MPTSHQHHDRQTTSWAMTAQATLHCLTGCAIGEVLGMVIGTALGLHNASTVVLSVALAFVFGYGLTMRGILRAGVPLRAAVATALAADTVSIAVMEIIDNGVIVAVPGAMDAGLSSALFWGSLLFSLVLAFVLTTTVNRWMISRGKGHAVVHAMHTEGQTSAPQPRRSLDASTPRARMKPGGTTTSSGVSSWIDA